MQNLNAKSTQRHLRKHEIKEKTQSTALRLTFEFQCH